jgi:hypothetical protein
MRVCFPFLLFVGFKIEVVSSFLITNRRITATSFANGEKKWKRKILELQSTTDEDQPQIIQSLSPELIESITSGESSQQFELWLDLRQTTISPQAALLHLTNDLWDEYIAPEDKAFLIDKVLVNSLDDNGTKKVMDDIEDEYEEEIEVLFQKDDIITSLKTIGLEGEDTDGEESNFPTKNVGKVFQIFDSETGMISVYANPMPALEVILSNQWLVLDSSDVEEKDERKEAIQSLVDLCNGSLTTGMSLGENSDNEDSVESDKGGIVIDCNTSADIFDAGALIKSLSGNENGYVSTESGILVQSSAQEEDSKILPIQREGVAIKYAILIPFDAILWKTASFVVANEEL